MRAEVFHIDHAVDIVESDAGSLRFILPGSEFTLRDPVGIVRRVSDHFQAGARVADVVKSFDGEDERQAATRIIEVFRTRRVLRPAVNAGYASADPVGVWLHHYAAAPDCAPGAVEIVGSGILAEALALRLGASGVLGHGANVSGAKRCVVAVADTPDMPWFRRLNAEACADGHVFLPGWLERSAAHWGPTLLPGATGCLECLLHRQQAARRRAESVIETSCERLATSETVAGIAAGLVAAEALRWAYDSHVETDFGMSWRFDLLTMNLTGSKVLRLPRCRACGNGPPC